MLLVRFLVVAECTCILSMWACCRHHHRSTQTERYKVECSNAHTCSGSETHYVPAMQRCSARLAAKHRVTCVAPTNAARVLHHRTIVWSTSSALALANLSCSHTGFMQLARSYSAFSWHKANDIWNATCAHCQYCGPVIPQKVKATVRL